MVAFRSLLLLGLLAGWCCARPLGLLYVAVLGEGVQGVVWWVGVNTWSLGTTLL